MPQARLPARLEHRLRDRVAGDRASESEAAILKPAGQPKLEPSGWHRHGLTGPDHSQRLIFPGPHFYKAGSVAKMAIGLSFSYGKLLPVAIGNVAICNRSSRFVLGCSHIAQSSRLTSSALVAGNRANAGTRALRSERGGAREARQELLKYSCCLKVKIAKKIFSLVIFIMTLHSHCEYRLRFGNWHIRVGPWQNEMDDRVCRSINSYCCATHHSIEMSQCPRVRHRVQISRRRSDRIG